MVANEVKELAKGTARATEEIGQKIEAIQNDTHGAVEAIAQIRNIIKEINDISNNIAAAVEEQTVTTNEISRNAAKRPAARCRSRTTSPASPPPRRTPPRAPPIPRPRLALSARWPPNYRTWWAASASDAQQENLS